ncbi:hypothetical protein [Streptomyces chartreusis]|uniref:hypothetical protein n=1 Tax=Streptomyces chartreusis TaxID=1969 RepID=UPI0033CB7D1C
MSAPAKPRTPNPGDLARHHGVPAPVVAAAPAPQVDEPAPTPAPAPETPAEAAAPAPGERPTPPSPMYEPRQLTPEQAIAPAVLADTEHFRRVFRWCLTQSGLPPHARLVAYDLLHRANHLSGRIGSAHQPDLVLLASATGLTELQASVALQVLHSRGWIAYRPDSTRRLFDLVIPALALEQARARRYLHQREQEQPTS